MTIKKLIGIVLLIVFIATIISTIKQNILEDFYETYMYAYEAYQVQEEVYQDWNTPFILSIVARAGTMILISTFITFGFIFLSAFLWVQLLMKDDLIGSLMPGRNTNIGGITVIPLNDSTGGFLVSPKKNSFDL